VSFASKLKTVKKVAFLLLFTITSLSARCDVITFGDFLCYSAEFIYSFEKIKKPQNTTTYWGGVGCVGGLGYHNAGQSYGLEIAVERRHYFKPDNFKNLFISAYLGSALMTEFTSSSRICLVPGIKINYKFKITSKLVLEPYCSISLPITHELTRYNENNIYPAITFGARFGINKLIDKMHSRYTLTHSVL
jgi:hypothetical protein